MLFDFVNHNIMGKNELSFNFEISIKLLNLQSVKMTKILCEKKIHPKLQAFHELNVELFLCLPLSSNFFINFLPLV